MKIMITERDEDKFEKVIDVEAKFVFFTIKDRIYYHDATTDKLWVTTIQDLVNGTDLLGDGHRKILKEELLGETK